MVTLLVSHEIGRRSCRPLAPILCSIHAGKSRKYRHTLEAIQPGPGDVWVGVHSALANKMVNKALEAGILKCEVRTRGKVFLHDPDSDMLLFVPF